jgi:hypothetical protein
MAEQEIYFVTGGEHMSMDFIAVKPGKSIMFGPFYTYQDAYDCWKDNMWLNVDNALYRLTIKKKLASVMKIV